MADTLQRELHQQTKQSLDAKILREKLTAWDTKDIPKAPLTDKQKDSFMELATQWSNRPLPTEPEVWLLLFELDSGVRCYQRVVIV